MGFFSSTSSGPSAEDIDEMERLRREIEGLKLILAAKQEVLERSVAVVDSMSSQLNIARATIASQAATIEGLSKELVESREHGDDGGSSSQEDAIAAQPFYVPPPLQQLQTSRVGSPDQLPGPPPPSSVSSPPNGCPPDAVQPSNELPLSPPPSVVNCPPSIATPPPGRAPCPPTIDRTSSWSLKGTGTWGVTRGVAITASPSTMVHRKQSTLPELAPACRITMAARASADNLQQRNQPRALFLG